MSPRSVIECSVNAASLRPSMRLRAASSAKASAVLPCEEQCGGGRLPGREEITSLSRYSTHDNTMGSPFPGTDSTDEAQNFKCAAPVAR